MSNTMIRDHRPATMGTGMVISNRLFELRDDILAIQSCIKEVFAHEGAVHCVSWKFPGLCAAELDIQDLIARYTVTTRDPHHSAVSKASLLELIVDRILLLAFALVYRANFETGKVPETTKDSHFQGTCTFSVLFELQNIISQLHENIQDHKIKLAEQVNANKAILLQLNTQAEQSSLLKEVLRTLDPNQGSSSDSRPQSWDTLFSKIYSAAAVTEECSKVTLIKPIMRDRLIQTTDTAMAPLSCDGCGQLKRALAKLNAVICDLSLPTVVQPDTIEGKKLSQVEDLTSGSGNQTDAASSPFMSTKSSMEWLQNHTDLIVHLSRLLNITQKELVAFKEGEKLAQEKIVLERQQAEEKLRVETARLRLQHEEILSIQQAEKVAIAQDYAEKLAHLQSMLELQRVESQSQLDEIIRKARAELHAVNESMTEKVKSHETAVRLLEGEKLAWKERARAEAIAHEAIQKENIELVGKMASLEKERQDIAKHRDMLNNEIRLVTEDIIAKEIKMKKMELDNQALEKRLNTVQTSHLRLLRNSLHNITIDDESDDDDIDDDDIDDDDDDNVDEEKRVDVTGDGISSVLVQKEPGSIKIKAAKRVKKGQKRKLSVAAEGISSEDNRRSSTGSNDDLEPIDAYASMIKANEKMKRMLKKYQKQLAAVTTAPSKSQRGSKDITISTAPEIGAVKARTSLGQVRHEHGRDQVDRRDSVLNDAASRRRSTGRLEIIPDLDADEVDAERTGQADPTTITQGQRGQKGTRLRAIKPTDSRAPVDNGSIIHDYAPSPSEPFFLKKPTPMWRKGPGESTLKKHPEIQPINPTDAGDRPKGGRK